MLSRTRTSGTTKPSAFDNCRRMPVIRAINEPGVPPRSSTKGIEFMPDAPQSPCQPPIG